MSSSRWGRNWADLEEDDAVDVPKQKARFESEVDAKGIKTVIEYAERDGKTFKVSKKVKQTNLTKKINLQIENRKTLTKFGKCGQAEDEDGNTIEIKPVVSSVDVPIEITKVIGGNQQAATVDDAEMKFYQESLAIADALFKEKKVWTDANRAKQEERDAEESAIKAPEVNEGLASLRSVMGGGKGAAEPTGGRYVPPSLRGTGATRPGETGGKGGKGDQQDASLRVTNLSDDAKDGDLQELFGQFGRLQRVFLSKDMETGRSKGFAFVTYYNKEDGEKAIKKLNGHGYDNLILQVSWAKPRV